MVAVSGFSSMTPKAENSRQARRLAGSFGRSLYSWAAGTVISVTCIVVLGVSYEDWLAAQIHRFKFEQMTDARKAEALKSAQPVSWRSADSVEYNWLLNVFGQQLANARDLPEYLKQPFRVSYVTLGGDDYYTVFWPRQCNNDGCRIDLIKYAENAIDSTFVVEGLKFTDATLNGKPVFADIQGTIYYFDGDDYVSQ